MERMNALRGIDYGWMILVMAAATVAAPPLASSQLNPPPGPPPGITTPEWWGEWSGPYLLRDLQNEAEIAHAAVLPPPADTSEGGESRLVFFTRQGTGICSSPTDMYVTAWIWDEDLRGNVTPVVDPTTPGDGSEDPFCSGHTFLPNGNLLVVGGQDYVEKCAIQQSTGHAGIRVLDTSVDPPVWIPSTALPGLVRARWYPTAITLDDGDAFIAGHANAPVASPVSAEVYERYD